MMEAMSDSRRKERTAWLLRRLEDHVIHVGRLQRYADELGLEHYAETLARHAEDLEDIIEEMQGEQS